MKSKVIGKRIEEILKRNRWNQTSFANEIGIPQSVISEMIRGRREIDRLINIVAERFGVSRDYLVTGVENNYKDIAESKVIYGVNELNNDEITKLENNLQMPYKKHQKLLDDASHVMKQIAAINQLLIIGTSTDDAIDNAITQ